MKKIFLLGLILFLNSVTVYANLITLDWKVPNDGLILYETDSNLEWLNLSQSYGMSYNKVLAMTDNPGGLYEGWHIAKKTEMVSLFNAVGGDGRYSIDGLTNGAGNSVDLLIQYWGVSLNENDTTYVVYDSVNWFQMELLVNFARLYNNPNYDDEGVLWPVPGRDDMEMDTEYFTDLHIGMPKMAIALVRTAQATPVPEPSTLLLMMIGSTGLIGACMKKRA